MAASVVLTGRTVLVGRRSLEDAVRVLNNIMRNDGLVKKIAQRRHYEKPTKKRERLEYEKCLRLYNREMKKKVAFVMRQHAPHPPI